MISPWFGLGRVGVSCLQAIEGVVLATRNYCPKTLIVFLGSEGDGYDFSNLQVVLQSNHIGPDSPLSSLASSVFLL
jgi:hypothetical protein